MVEQHYVQWGAFGHSMEVGVVELLVQLVSRLRLLGDTGLVVVEVGVVVGAAVAAAEAGTSQHCGWCCCR